jgi:hypothetical protein
MLFHAPAGTRRLRSTFRPTAFHAWARAIPARGNMQ